MIDDIIEDAKPKKTYYQTYYKKHKDALLAAKKDRYANDPEYREGVMRRARESKKKLLAENRKAKVAAGGRDAPIRFCIEVDGIGEIEVIMYTAGQLARKLGRKTQTIRVWERKGTIPEAMYRNVAKDRLYTELQVRLIVKAYDAAERKFGVDKVSNRISSTDFSERVHKIWADYPLGIEE